MVGDALQAFCPHDMNLAIQVARDDDAVDELCDRLQRELMDKMREDSTLVEQATRLLLVARVLERTAITPQTCEQLITSKRRNATTGARAARTTPNTASKRVATTRATDHHNAEHWRTTPTCRRPRLTAPRLHIDELNTIVSEQAALRNRSQACFVREGFSLRSERRALSANAVARVTAWSVLS
jgi:hypothetical protein